MRQLYLFILIIIICPCCSESKTDWKAVCDSLDADFAEYGRTYSEDVYNKIISKCDMIIESSPEFCNYALMAKSSILAYSDQYDEAVKVAEQIPDTAAVYSSFRSKTVYINDLLSYKYKKLGDEDSAKMYNDKIISELEDWISARKDSLCHALSLPIETPVIRNQYIVAFIIYLEHVAYYDCQEVKRIIETVKRNIPEYNENEIDILKIYLSDCYNDSIQE